jgi:anti-anti-sigma factor
MHTTNPIPETPATLEEDVPVPGPLRISCEHPDATTAALRARGTAALPTLQQALEADAADPGAHTLIIDLSELDFLSVSALPMLAATVRQAENNGVSVRILALDPVVIRALSLAGLTPAPAALPTGQPVPVPPLTGPARTDRGQKEPA